MGAVSIGGLTAYLQSLVTFEFCALGIATAVAWFRHRDRSLRFLALALVLLSAVALLAHLSPAQGWPTALLSAVLVAGFLGSGLALLLYRADFIPLRPGAQRFAFAAALAAGLLYMAIEAAMRFQLSTKEGLFASVVVVLAWCALVLDPVVRFWTASSGLPTVQKARLRALSAGVAGLVIAMLLSVVVDSAATSSAAIFVTNLLLAGALPLVYLSFKPPAWLRMHWRAAEETELRLTMQDLMLRPDDGDEIATHALELTMRLVGADGALVFADDGRVLIARGSGHDVDRLLIETLRELGEGVNQVAMSGRFSTVLVLKIPSASGISRLVLLAGPFTPLFGIDDYNRIHQYASAVSAGLDRARLIAQLRATNDELRSASEHKSTFLANMSHELRTPLNAILGFTELLIDDTDGHYDAVTRMRFLRQVNSAGQHLLSLINDVLDLSKVEAGRMELRPEDVEVGELIDQVLATVMPLANKKGITLASSNQSGARLIADRGKLKQMLLNLVSNAIKFTPDGGSVAIDVTAVSDWVEFAVRDNGIGIAPEDIDQLFQAFQQVDSGRDRQQQGTGLGLALTRRLAELHGGTITVASSKGQGTTFSLRLPTRPPERREAAPAMVLPLPTRPTDDDRPLVLIVEDDPDTAELLARQLDRGGFRHAVVSDGRESVAEALRLQPALITLDVLLPERDGWSVLSELKGNAATRNIPVIVVSVVDDPELARTLGALDYFVKPVDSKALLTRLEPYRKKRQPQARKTKILVVDDEPMNRNILAEVLKPAGFDVTLAESGAEAIARVKQQKPDLILLDLVMPETTGFDVVEALQSSKATRAIPILILTAKELSEEERRRLSGQVSAILGRSSIAAADLVHWLERVKKAVAV
jgi:signal transduction histidine kinase/CheY-like chemotaxis protein